MNTPEGINRRAAILLLTTTGTVFALPSPTAAEPTRELYISDAKEVFEGDPVSTSLDAQGHISAGPLLRELVGRSDQAVLTMKPGPRGTLLVGTAKGKLLRIDAEGKSRVIAQRAGKAITAIARTRAGVYYATGPDGEIRFVNTAGKDRPFFQPAAKYIWDMVPDGKNLLVATGLPGRLMRVAPGGRSTVIFDPKEEHLRVLLREKRSSVLVGGGQKGVVYRIKDKTPFGLFDSSMEEITAFCRDPKTGDIYAAAVSETKKGNLLPDTFIGPVKKEEKDEDSSPIKSSEVVRISPSGQVQRIWTSNREGALALVFDQKTRRVFIATGSSRKNRARVYAVDTGDRDRVLLAARLEDPLATALLPAPDGGGLVTGAAPSGRVVRIGPGYLPKSTYLSVEQDLGRPSRIGRLWYRAEIPPKAEVAVSIRTGNTAEPDATWSAWSTPVEDAEGGPADVPWGRYAQLRAELTAGANGRSPRVTSMHASVIRMNVAPEVVEVFLLRRGVYMKTIPSESLKERTVTLSESALKDLRRPRAKPKGGARVRQGEEDGMMTAAWRATDKNRDRLLYTVELSALDDPKGGWRTVAEDLEVPYYSFDSRTYPDGRYQFRVTASDRPANPPSEALTDRYASEEFVIDNGAPELSALSASTPRPGQVRVRAHAEDAVSPVVRAEVSVDGGPWLMLPARDGLLDAKSEDLEVTVEPGARAPARGNAPRYVLQVRIEDRAGNEATASASVSR